MVILVISIKDNSKKSDSPKTKEAITMQQIIKPMVKKIEEPFLFEDKKTSSKEEITEKVEDEELPAVSVKDLPLDEITDKTEQGREKSPEEIEAPATPSLQTQPSLEDMKLIKKKGFVIY